MVSIALALLGTNPSPLVQPALAKPGAAIEIVYDAEMWSRGLPPATKEQLKSIELSLREANEKSKLTEEMIKGMLLDDAKGRPDKLVKRTVRLTWKDGVLKGEKVNKGGPMSGWTNYTNGLLLLERYDEKPKPSNQIMPTSGYEVPSTIGMGSFPVLLGAVSAEQFSALVRRPVIDPSTGRRTTATQEMRYELTDDGHVKKMIGIRTARQVAKASDIGSVSWTAEVPTRRNTEGVSVPATIVLKSFNLEGALMSRTTVRLKSADLNPSKDLSDMEGMGFKGEKVCDCRFGTDNWVNYINDGRLKSDEEVKKLLEKRLASGSKS